jgi:hypothetical protein
VFDDVAATALLSDTNGSGLPGAGDQFLFGSQPVIEGTLWNPTDQGGGFFVVTLGEGDEPIQPSAPLSARAPVDVCLVFDDVHHLPLDSWPMRCLASSSRSCRAIFIS